MRKITFLMGIVLTVLVSLSSRAQEIQDIGTPLITDAEQLSSPFSEDPANEVPSCVLPSLIDQDDETYWHSSWSNTGTVPHYLDVSFPQEVSGDLILYVVRRRGAANDHPTSFLVEGSSDAATWVKLDTVNLSFDGAGTPALSDPFTIGEPVTNLRFTAIDCAPTYRIFWHCAEFQLYQPDQAAYAAYLLNQLLLKYDGCLSETEEEPFFDFGDQVGQYTDRASYALFKEKVQWIQSVMEGSIEAEIDIQTAKELAAEIEALYQAVLDSKIEMPAFADGYYFLTTAMTYTSTIRTPILDEEGNPVLDENNEPTYNEEVTTSVKAAYMSENTMRWQSLEENKDATFLFHLTYDPETGYYDMVNCGNDGRVADVAQSTTVKLDPTLEAEGNEMTITYVRTDAEKGFVVVLRRASQSGDFQYLHQNGHGGGTGSGADVVGWAADAGASQWCLVKVDDAEAQALIEEYAPIRDRDAMLKEVASMVSKGQDALVVAEDIITEVNTEEPLIASETQFSSPYTTADEQKNENEESYTPDNCYGLLIDGNASTYWHSRWEDGNVAGGLHYLQVELTAPEEVTGAAFTFTRRAVANDHITQWGIYGTNDAEAEKDACEFLAEIYTPFASNTETLTSDGFPTKGYKYIRFYLDATTTGRGYGHVSEFQLYPATITENPTSQLKMMGEIATNLQAAIAAVPEDEDDITLDHYTALKAAYDAFMAIYVDPADLRTAIAAANEKVAIVVVGTTPGTWAEGAADALQAKIAEAQTYDKAGVYTPANSEELIAGLEAATADMIASANKVEAGKWYRLRFTTEEAYEEHDWDKGPAADESTLGNLFGQYVNVGLLNQENAEEPVFELIAATDMREGNNLFFADELDEDASLFRFIEVGDSAYVIQNRGCGLYINCAGANNSNVRLSLNPTTFKITALGYGNVLISGMSLTGEGRTNLHAQKSGHRLVTWESNTLGSNSSLVIEPADDVTGDVANGFSRDIVPGKIYAQCYPVGLSAEEGTMYTVAGTYTQDEKHYIALNTIDGAKAGEPFIYIYGAPEDFIVPEVGEDGESAEQETVVVPFTAGAEVVSEAGRANDLVGTFTYQWVDNGTTVFVDNRAEGAFGEEGTDCTRDVYENAAYLDFGTTEADPAGSYDLVIEVQGEINTDAIEHVINKVAKAGRIYSIDGKLVRENGTLNDVRSLGTGIYILNGVKVSVK